MFEPIEFSIEKWENIDNYLYIEWEDGHGIMKQLVGNSNIERYNNLRNYMDNRVTINDAREISLARIIASNETPAQFALTMNSIIGQQFRWNPSVARIERWNGSIWVSI